MASGFILLQNIYGHTFALNIKLNEYCNFVLIIFIVLLLKLFENSENFCALDGNVLQTL